MKAQTKLKALSKGNKTYIHLYWVYKGTRVIISTGIEFSRSYCRNDCTFKATKQDYQLLNSRLNNLQRKANDYIQYCIEHNKPVLNNDCKEYVFSKWILPTQWFNKEQYERPTRYFALEWFDDFMTFKKQQVKSSFSLKDYKSLHNALLDYERDNSKLSFHTMNSLEWIYNFRDYLRMSRPNENHLEKSRRVYLSKGNLQDTTINKRLQTLKNWFIWVEKKGLCVFDKDVMKYNVEKGKQEIIALSIDEIKSIYYYDKYLNNERYLIDVFVMNCYLGLRYQDLKNLNKDNFIYLDNELYYITFNSKTQERIEVPVLPIAYEVLNKYEFKIKVYANAVFNRRLKEILKKHNLLEREVKVNETRNGRTINLVHKLNDVVSTHTCRKSFITNALLNNVPLNVVMKATGHTQISTVQKYAEKKRDYDAFKGMM